MNIFLQIYDSVNYHVQGVWYFSYQSDQEEQVVKIACHPSCQLAYQIVGST